MNAHLAGRVRSGLVRSGSVAALLLLSDGGAALGQDERDGPGAATATRARATDDASSREISQAELDQMLAGYALYPDSLLSQILIACTYPIEVVQADRWAKEHAGLEGDALAAALEAQSWDPSVRSLVNFPDVLAGLSENIEWTAKIGDAFIADERRVMDTVQALRAKAKDQGNLESNDEQRVVVERAPEGVTTVRETTIIIESARPEVVYVPVYDPVVVYGAWWWPAYSPPIYCRPAYWGPGPIVWWGRPRYCGPAWGYAWSRCDWGGSFVSIDINLNFGFNHHINRHHYRDYCERRFGWHDGRGRWSHDPHHRRGVAYRDEQSAHQFGGVSVAQSERTREGFRPRAEEGRREIERETRAGRDPRGEGSRGPSSRRADDGEVRTGGTSTVRRDSKPGSGNASDDDGKRATSTVRRESRAEGRTPDSDDRKGGTSTVRREPRVESRDSDERKGGTATVRREPRPEAAPDDDRRGGTATVRRPAREGDERAASQPERRSPAGSGAGQGGAGQGSSGRAGRVEGGSGAGAPPVAAPRERSGSFERAAPSSSRGGAGASPRGGSSGESGRSMGGGSTSGRSGGGASSGGSSRGGSGGRGGGGSSGSGGGGSGKRSD